MKKKNFWKIKKNFFSGKFEKKIFSENCEKIFSRFLQGGGGQLLWGGNYTLKITVPKRPQIRLPPPPQMAIFLGGGVNFFSERGSILS